LNSEKKERKIPHWITPFIWIVFILFVLYFSLATPRKLYQRITFRDYTDPFRDAIVLTNNDLTLKEVNGEWKLSGSLQFRAAKYVSIFVYDANEWTIVEQNTQLEYKGHPLHMSTWEPPNGMTKAALLFYIGHFSTKQLDYLFEVIKRSNGDYLQMNAAMSEIKEGTNWEFYLTEVDYVSCIYQKKRYGAWYSQSCPPDFNSIYDNGRYLD
jgi:hypothetical protein